MRLQRGIICCLILAAFVAGGCIFEPREPEEPGVEKEPWITPNQAEDVFLNLASGLRASSNSNYERSLDVAFVFLPHPQDESQFGSIYDGWNKEREMRFLNRIKGEFPGLREIRFGDASGSWDERIEETGRIVFRGEYRIEAVNGAGVTETFSAKAEFEIVSGSQGWVLSSWEDYELISPFPSAGAMRGTYGTAD